MLRGERDEEHGTSAHFDAVPRGVRCFLSCCVLACFRLFAHRARRNALFNMSYHSCVDLLKECSFPPDPHVHPPQQPPSAACLCMRGFRPTATRRCLELRLSLSVLLDGYDNIS